MRKNIKEIVAYYKRKYRTNNPFEIADCLGILYQFGELGFEGCYMFLKNHRYIFLDQNLSEHETALVMAHELGHAILHPKTNCYFMRNYTLLLTSKLEIEANKFAVELLIPDEVILENWQYTTGQFARLTGYNEELIKLRLKGFNNAIPTELA